MFIYVDASSSFFSIAKNIEMSNLLVNILFAFFVIILFVLRPTPNVDSNIAT